MPREIKEAYLLHRASIATASSNEFNQAPKRKDKNPKEVVREEPTSGSGKSKTKPKRSR